MKKFSIFICSFISLILWIATSFVYREAKQDTEPAALTALLQKNVLTQEQSVLDLLHNKPLMNRIWAQTLTEKDLNFLTEQAFTLQLYDSGQLVFWNRNDFPVTEKRFFASITPLMEHGSAFLYQSAGNAQYPTRRINVIMPVFTNYKVNNDYLKSAYAASPLIPNTSSISLHHGTNDAVLIKSKDHTPLFYIRIDQQNIKSFNPLGLTLFFIILSFLSTVLCIHLIATYITKRVSVLSGIGFLLGLLILRRLYIYYFGFPFGIDNSELFSPQIFASNSFLPSIGHLFIHIMLIYWFIWFVNEQSIKLKNFKCSKLGKRACFAIFLTTNVLITVFALYLQNLLQSLVFNSNISFDTNTFAATGKFTIFAILIIALIARILLMALQLSNNIKVVTMPNIRQRYLWIFVIPLIIVFVYNYFALPYIDNPIWADKWLNYIAVIWISVFSYIVNLPKIKKLFPHKGLFSLIFLSVFFSMILSVYFKIYIDKKEQNITLPAFAEKLSRKQSTEMELNFDNVALKIQNDETIQNWFLDKDSIDATYAYKHLKMLSTELFISQYAQDIYAYDPKGHSILIQNETALDSLKSLQKSSSPTLSQYLFFNIDSSDNGNYLAYIPIKESHTDSALGSIIVCFNLKTYFTQSVYPKILQNYKEYNLIKENKYDYAIYKNGKIVNQSGLFDFKRNIPDDSLERGQHKFTKDGSVSIMNYKAGPKLQYSVVYKNNFFLGALTIFSLLFGFFLIITSADNALKTTAYVCLSGKRLRLFKNRSLSVRVKYFVLGFAAVSFFIIGLFTVFFIKNRYQANSIVSIENRINNATEATTDYIQNQRFKHKAANINDFLVKSNLSNFLFDISQQQKIDFNLFNTSGTLIFSTQEKIYDAQILAKQMSPKALYTFSHKKVSNFIQAEYIGKLGYTAAYMPIKNEENQTIGFLNIPSFYSKEYMDKEIVSLITTLINIYTLLIIFSSIITFLFINSLSQSLKIVTESLKNVNLNKNELINWPYKDEIGLLVEEYNKMVATVEKNARSLVLDERQNAWREMAQQVAHEIKNPLTPMKLNIQYLQQAINANHPDIINLTKRVSSSIIEQIDNLNYIASEFSNFAKMPENKTERIELKSMLDRIVLLFSGNKDIEIIHHFPSEPVIVFADKSQMLRIVTNIVQNAVESLPTEERKGTVELDLTYTEERDAVIIKVSDNGIGIPSDLKSKIFDPYFTTKSSGTGLGLAMSKKIIELWGGEIKFESEEHVGTTFTITIPLG